MRWGVAVFTKHLSGYPFGTREGQALLACEIVARGRLLGFQMLPRCARHDAMGKRHIRSNSAPSIKPSRAY